MSPRAVRFAGPAGVWGVLHPARDMACASHGEDRNHVYLVRSARPLWGGGCSAALHVPLRFH